MLVTEPVVDNVIQTRLFKTNEQNINNAYEFDTKKNKTKNEQDLENLKIDIKHFKKELGINNTQIYSNGR